MSEVGGGSPANAAEYFGNEVKALREALGMSQAEFAKELKYGAAQVCKVEGGQVLASESFAMAVDRVAGTPGVYVRLRARLVSLGHPDWFLPYVTLEEKATWVRIFHPQLVPGLAQTPEYARAVLRTGRPENLEELVAARMSRQKILRRTHKPPARLWLVLNEAALRTKVGDSMVMRGQLEHLRALAEVPRHRVQIIPDGGWDHGSPSVFGPFGLLSFDDGPDAAHVDGFPRGYVLLEPDHVREAEEAYDLLTAAAAPPGKTADLINSVLKDFRS
ncbi:helix-turn-helix domain-containing protein [Streptomyces sp. 4F14]|uniref:helix-turn-helix domain-containing protein n=1 Tax=Streptomyces sp. 4F14 TaxID=3394380 RepID=UPI003A89C769